MILEALNYAATWPLTKPEHRFAVGASVSLWSRGRRCRGDWREHEENCRRFILEKAKALKTRRTAVVLGSGLLREVPVDILSQIFDTVVLVDLVHPASVRAALVFRRLRNVRPVERDLSGYGDLAEGRAPEPLGFLRQVPYLDLVVSANLLTQIGTGAMRKLERERPGAMPEDTVPRLISAHLEGLAALPCATCLITDTFFQTLGRDGRVLDAGDLLHGVAPPAATVEWDWTLVPFGEESRDYRIVHRVVAA